MRALLPIAILLTTMLASAALAGEEEKNLAGLEPRWKRLKAAKDLAGAGDVNAVYRAVIASGDRGHADDVEVLASLALDEDNPLLRLLYGRGLEKIGAEKVVAVLTDKIGSGQTDQKLRGLEVLGYLRDETTIDTLFKYAGDVDRAVATEAYRALARFLPRKELGRLAEAVVATRDDDAARRGAWACADVARSPKGAAAALKKLARGKGPEVDRAKSLMSDVSEEGIDQVYRYGKTHLVAVEDWFTKRKPAVNVEGDPLAKRNINKALEYLEKKCPSYHQLVIRAFDTIASRVQQEKIDWPTRTLVLSPGTAASSLWKPHQHATLLVRGAVQMLLRDLGDVHWFRRGFEQAGKNLYWFTQNHSGFELGETRNEFVDAILKRKLWR